MIDRTALLNTAWNMARRAAQRLGGSARDHLANCLRCAWMLARKRVVVATAAVAVAAVTPVAAQQEPAMPETATVETIPAAVPFRAPIVRSCVRGGGCGARAWIARITGLHPQFVFEREFVEKHANTSRSGRSGSMWWQLPEPGYYEYRGLQYDMNEARIGQLDNCYVEVRTDGVIYEATRAEILEAFKADAA